MSRRAARRASAQPLSQGRGPPMTCMCRCCTSWRPSAPVLISVRKPLRHAQLAHQPRRQRQHAAEQRRVLGGRRRTCVAMCCLGMISTCTGAHGCDVVEDQQLVVLVDLLRPGSCRRRSCRRCSSGRGSSLRLLRPASARWRSGSASRARCGRGTRSRSAPQAIQPGTSNSSHSGAVTRYSPPAHSTVRMRQLKCDSCQVPAALVLLHQVDDEGHDQQRHAGLRAGHDRADGHDQVQQVADVADVLQRGLRARRVR